MRSLFTLAAPGRPLKLTSRAGPNPRSGPILLLTAQTMLLLAMTVTVVTKVWQDHVWFGWLLVGVTCRGLASGS